MSGNTHNRFAQSDKGTRTRRAFALLLLAVLVLSLLPLYAAAQFSFAGMDDYRYGRTTHAVWESTHSFPQTMWEAGRVAARTYTEWQGSLVAIFLMALQPGVFSDRAYGASTLVLLTTLVLALLYFVHTLLTRAFRTDRWTALAVAAVTAIACVQFVPAPVESYYWFNGGVYYTFFFSLLLLAAALLMRRERRKTAAQGVLLPLLAVCIGLGNLITGLLSCVLLAVYAVAFAAHKRRDGLIRLSLLLLLIAFAVNVFSPGNGVRQAEHAGEGLSALAAILAGMGDAAAFIGKWMRTPAPYLLLVALPLIWRALPTEGFRYRFPLAVTAASFLLLAAGFTPNEYALGLPGEARIVDIQYYLFLLLLLGNLVWYAGWLKQARVAAQLPRWLPAAIAAAALIACGALVVTTHNCVSVSAFNLLRSGKAAAYAEAWEERLAVLRAPGGGDVVLQALPSEPPLLCMVDIEADADAPFYFYNEQLAAYFSLDSVLREP